MASQDTMEIQWQCGICTLLNAQSLKKCSACDADRPIASYTMINELEKQQKAHLKQENDIKLAKQQSLEKARSQSRRDRAANHSQQQWGDDDFVDDDDGAFDDGGWDDEDDNNNNNNNNNGDNDADWSMGSTNNNNNKNADNDTDMKDDFKDSNNNNVDDDWGDLGDQTQTIIKRDYSVKVVEFEILNPYKLHEYMQNILTEMQGVLYMDKLEKIAVLCRYYRWNREKMLDKWMMDQDKITKEVGLKSQNVGTPVPRSGEFYFCYTCCDDKVEWKNTFHLGCHHIFCSNCWQNYLTAQMEKGPRVVSQARCMDPKCRLAVPPLTFEKFLDFKHRNKYQEYLLHSFVQGRKELEWCPGRDCINAAKAEFGSVITVECSCKHLWCFTCKMDAHLPVNCGVAEKWSKLCNSDSENLTWVNAYAKKCVKCKNFIEKNQGCSHMTCRCGYEFCWLCQKEWKGAGGYGHTCKKPKDVLESESQQKELQGYLERFTHYGERYTFNEQAVKITIDKSLKNATNIVHTLIQTKDNIKYNDLEFILDAIQEIIRSRRILQWTYCYGYYCKDKTNQKELFETQQSLLERFADELHDKAEKVVDDPEQHTKVLELQYRQNIITLTKTVTKYRKNITEALQVEEIIYQKGILNGQFNP